MLASRGRLGRGVRLLARRTQVLLVLVLCLEAAFATPACGEWQHFTTQDGLCSNMVLDVMEDSSGTIWFTMPNGVTKREGLGWVSYEATGQHPCLSGPVTAVCEDAHGGIWFACGQAGVCHFDGEDWTHWTEDDGLGAREVRDVAASADGDVWCATWGGGVSRFDGEVWTVYGIASGLASDFSHSVFVDDSGRVWVGSDNGVSWRDPSAGWTVLTTADGLAHNTVHAITANSFGEMWFGTQGGASHYDEPHWTTYTLGDSLGSNSVRSIIEDDLGRIWFGTDGGGLSRYDGARWVTWTTGEGLPSNSVRAMAKDASGNVWLATGWDGGGAVRSDGVSWTTFFPTESVIGIAEAGDGSIWVGASDTGPTEGGVHSFDGVDWTTYTSEDGLGGDDVGAVAAGNSGVLWFGIRDVGVTRFDGLDWTTYTTADGLASASVQAIVEDASGAMWFATWEGGASRFDGSEWTTYTTEDGLVDNGVQAVFEDISGDMWFGTLYGVSRFDGESWTTYTTADGLAESCVRGIAQDSFGRMLFATDEGLSVYDGLTWETHTVEDGLSDDALADVKVSQTGAVWVGTNSGASRYRNSEWGSYRTAEGLADDDVGAVFEDSSGRIWFGTAAGLTLHEIDWVAPETIIWPNPPALVATRSITVHFTCAYGEHSGVELSSSIDESSWSDWSAPPGVVTIGGMSDGFHELAIRARDGIGNVDSMPAIARFEVDATPPAPAFILPVHATAVRESLTIRGTADDPRFDSYELDVRPFGSGSWHQLEKSSTPLPVGIVGGWNTSLVPDGEYEIRLSMSDTLGLVGVTTIHVEVDNEAPWAPETSPVQLTVAAGGIVSSIDGGLRLHFPPRALTNSATVIVVPTSEGSVPDTLPGGAKLLREGYDVAWEDVELEKPATLEFSYDGSLSDTARGRHPALYVSTGDGRTRIGGTFDVGRGVVSASVRLEGTYSLFADLGGTDLPDGLSPLSFSPRAFSPAGGFSRDEVAITFTLGTSGKVTAGVYNRGGRLIRELAAGRGMVAGANALWWDGRDEAGGEVPDGLYLVSVNALGVGRVGTLAVVR